MRILVELPTCSEAFISAPDELPYDTNTHPRLIGADNCDVSCGMLRLLSKPLADTIEQQREQGIPATSAVKWAKRPRYYVGQSCGWEMETEDMAEMNARETDTVCFSQGFSLDQHGPGHEPTR
jgi:hypothetical protein